MLNFKVKSFKEAKPQSRHKTTHCIRYGVLTLGCSWPSLAAPWLSIPSPPFVFPSLHHNFPDSGPWSGILVPLCAAGGSALFNTARVWAVLRVLPRCEWCLHALRKGQEAVGDTLPVSASAILSFSLTLSPPLLKFAASHHTRRYRRPVTRDRTDCNPGTPCHAHRQHLVSLLPFIASFPSLLSLPSRLSPCSIPVFDSFCVSRPRISHSMMVVRCL